MDDCAKRSYDPAAHQPSKAEIEEVSIDAPPESLAWAVTRGGAKRNSAADRDQDPLNT